MTKRDIHQDVTDQIIATLEKGTVPWVKEWDGPMGAALPERANGELYQGINSVILMMKKYANGYKSRGWMTFKQAKDLGGMVRKGEKSTQVIYYSTFKKEDPDTKDEKVIGFLKTYNVFNRDQIDGLPEQTIENPVAGGEGHIDDIKAFFDATRAKIEHGEHINPHWRPSTDTIGMPPIEKFSSAHAYYGTLAHELTHWTGHTPRLDRDMKYQTKEGRAFEELIAELGSLFLCAHIGAKPDHDNAAAYIESWLAALRKDKKFIFRAAAAAQAATNYALDRGRPKLTAIAAE